MTLQESEYERRVDGPNGPVRDEAIFAPPLATRADVRTAHSTRFQPDAFVAGAVGIVLVAVGLIAVTRGGFSGDMSEPVVEVAGFTHTTTLGAIEIVLGLFLLAAAAARSRPGAAFFGTVLGLGGFVGAVQASSFEGSLALESSMAWLALVAGAIVVLSALFMPRFARDSTTITTA
jgi:hypothetical protein